MVYFYNNNLIKDEDIINQDLLEYYKYCIHYYFKNNLLANEAPKKIESDYGKCTLSGN